jgi:hypothetical protein
LPLEYFPAPQLWQLVAPLAEIWPPAQSSQPLWFPATYFPASQSRQLLSFFAENLPPEQLMQLLAPLFEY